MNSSDILIDERVRIAIEGDVATVSLARPDKHNAMDFRMLRALVAAQKRLRKGASSQSPGDFGSTPKAVPQGSANRPQRLADNIRVVLLRGEGASFCAGIDVKSVFGNKREVLWGFMRLFTLTRNVFQQWSLGWRDLPVPVIALIHGNCLGAGVQLALGADIRITTPDSKLAILEAKWGLVPDMGGTVLLRELVPIDVAKELTLTGRMLSGRAAKALGLVTHVADDPAAHAMSLIAELRERSPDSVAAGKFLLQEAWESDEEGALGAERRRQRQMLTSANQRIAVRRNTSDDPPAYGPRRIHR